MLTAKLILERLDKEGRLLERREQQSRSFTKGFLELLYMAHVHIADSSPYTMTDIDGYARDVDHETRSENRDSKANIKIGATPGDSGMYCCPGMPAGSTSLPPHTTTIKGQFIGTQVGRGTTAVTPTDTKMEDRIFHGSHGIDGAPVLYTYYITGDNEDGHHGIYPDYQEGQSFKVDKALHITSVKLKVFRTGSPGLMTVAIQKGDVDGKPDGVDLGTKDVDCDAIAAASPGEWVTWTFAASIALEPWITYCIVVRGGVDYNNELNWRNDGSSPTYKRGNLLYSSDAGASWSTHGDDYMFEVWGQVEAGSAPLEYGGCELIGLTFSDPNGEFTIRRYFTNHSGGSITVNEVGMHSVATDYGYKWAWAFLIAHDIVSPGVAVADTELLRATYVPQITV
ncbi:hypothetical protein ES703_53270 [subsurface metagenome]